MQAKMKTKILPLVKGTSQRRKTVYLLGRRTKHLLGKLLFYYTYCPRSYHPSDSVLSQEVSDTSDNDHFEITGDDSTPTGLRNAKRKRPRSRSRSITPPPVLSAYQIQNAKRIVRCAFSPFFSVTSHSHQSSYHLEKH